MKFTICKTLPVFLLSLMYSINSSDKKIIEIIARNENTGLPHIITNNDLNLASVAKNEVINLAHLTLGSSFLTFGTLALTESVSTAYYELTEAARENEHLSSSLITGFEVLPQTIAGILLTYIGYKELIKSSWPTRAKNSFRSAFKKLV